MERFGRRLQVGEVDSFSFDDAKWLDGEEITSFTVDLQDDLVELVSSSYEGVKVTALLKGLSAGGSNLRYNIETQYRSHYIDGLIIVKQ